MSKSAMRSNEWQRRAVAQLDEVGLLLIFLSEHLEGRMGEGAYRA